MAKSMYGQTGFDEILNIVTCLLSAGLYDRVIREQERIAEDRERE